MLKYLTKKQKLVFWGSIVNLTLLAALVTVVSVMYINSSFGWFVNNMATNAAGPSVRTQNIDAEAEYTCFVYDAKLATVHYSGEGGASDPFINDLKMPVHDVIFKQRNRYTPAIVHIHLSRINSDYLNGGNVNFRITRDSSPAYETEGGRMLLPKKSSSIMRFTLINDHELNSSNTSPWLSSDPDPSVAANELYANIDNALYQKIVLNKDYTSTAAANISSAVFTTVTTDGTGAISGVTKQDSITLTVPFSAGDIVNGEMDLFIYMTYDEDLIGFFQHAEGLDTSSTAVGRVTTLENDYDDMAITITGN